MATGAIYVRGDGETTTASPQDILALTRRSQQGETPAPNISVQPGGAMQRMPFLSTPDLEVAEWLVNSLVEVGSTKPPTHQPLWTPPPLTFGNQDNDPERYDQSDIKQFVKEVVPRVQGFREAMVASHGPHFTLVVTNLDSHQSAFQLRLQFPTTVQARRYEPESDSWSPLDELVVCLVIG